MEKRVVVQQGVPEEVVIVTVLLSLVLGLIALVGGFFTTGVTQVILFTAAVCFMVHSLIELLLVVLTLLTRK